MSLEKQVARRIWETSRRDEGSVSAMGADIIAKTLVAEGLVPELPLRFEYRVEIHRPSEGAYYTLTPTFSTHEDALEVAQYVQNDFRIVRRQVSEWTVLP